MKKKPMTALPMEGYAKARNKQLKAKQAEMAAAKTPVASSMSAHDARYDFDTLTRAEEIKRDKGRHKGAKTHARQQLKHIKNIVGGGKRKVAGGKTFTPGAVKET